MSREAPDQRAPTETSLSRILAPKLPWQSNGVKDTRWPGHLIPLLLCDLTYHLSQDQVPILPYHSQPHITNPPFPINFSITFLTPTQLKTQTHK